MKATKRILQIVALLLVLGIVSAFSYGLGWRDSVLTDQRHLIFLPAIALDIRNGHPEKALNVAESGMDDGVLNLMWQEEQPTRFLLTAHEAWDGLMHREKGRIWREDMLSVVRAYLRFYPKSAISPEAVAYLKANGGK
jgi:hypothetical protein